MDPVRGLIDRRVPWAVHDEIFSHQYLGTGPLLAQGWKLHVSATPLSCVEVLERALDVLLVQGARFKVVNSLSNLIEMNSGRCGLSQVGKFITVYPSDDATAVTLAVALHEATSGLRGPRVPSDRPLRPGSLVHYRYGVQHAPVSGDLDDTDILLDGAGRLTSDERFPFYLAPQAVADPFEAAGAYVAAPSRSALLEGRYLVNDALSMSARGNVFRAVDIGARPARLCLVKEGRRDVAVDDRGRDARDWARNERRILARHAGSAFLPQLFDSFAIGEDEYNVIEYIEGKPLDVSLIDAHGRLDRIDCAAIAPLARGVAQALIGLHEQGIVFRDLNFANIILTPDGDYRLIDFGIAYDGSVDGEPPLSGGTPPFYPPEQLAGERPLPSDDVFAWGALLYHLACGEASVASVAKPASELSAFSRRPVLELRPDCPAPLAAIIDRAVSWRREDRHPSMRAALHALTDAVSFDGRPSIPEHAPMRIPVAEPSGETGARGELSSADALSLACEVGEALSSAAMERDGGICWATSNEVQPRPMLAPDLYSGVAGIGLYLAELASRTGHVRYADLARGAARWLAGPSWSRGRARHGLHGGEPGIAFFFLRLAELLNEPAYFDAASLRMRRLRGAAPLTDDILHGRAGTLLVLLELHRATQDGQFLEEARELGDALVAKAIATPGVAGGSYWHVRPAARAGAGGDFLGLLHGAAGIGLALAMLAAATGSEAYLEAARAAGETLLSQARRDSVTPNGGDAQDEAIAWPRALSDASTGLQAHCHGAGGVGLFFLRLNQMHQDPRYLAAVRGAAATIARQAAGEGHFCMCHGLSGSGHFLLDCHQVLDNNHWLGHARKCARLLENFKYPKLPGVYGKDGGQVSIHGSGETSGQISPDLMLGYAGVGAFLLRLASPGTGEPVLGHCVPRSWRVIPTPRRAE